MTYVMVIFGSSMIQNESSQLINGSFLQTKPVYSGYKIMRKNEKGIIFIGLEVGMRWEST